MSYTKCLRCNRALKNPASQEIGYGVVCARKMGKSAQAARQNDLFDDQNFPMLPLFDAPQKIGIVCQRLPDGRLATNVPHQITVHSQTGFECGYLGSGPADFALNALMCFTDKETAMHLHQDFKAEFIAVLPKNGGVLTLDNIDQFLRNKGAIPLGDYKYRKTDEILIHEGNI